MYGGNKQGGGGSNFVSLTGLFRSAKGRVGSISPDAFQVIQDIMDDCVAQGTEMMFFIADEDRDANGKPNPKTAGRLYVTVGRPKQERGGQRHNGPGRGGWNRGNAGGGRSYPQRGQQTAPIGKRDFASKRSNNPPKDELEQFLAKFDEQPEE